MAHKQYTCKHTMQKTQTQTHNYTNTLTYMPTNTNTIILTHKLTHIHASTHKHKHITLTYMQAHAKQGKLCINKKSTSGKVNSGSIFS